MTDKSKQEKTLLMTRLMTPDMSNFPERFMEAQF